MVHKNLIYIPTGLNSPETEVLTATCQSLIDKNQDVTILTCSGGLNYSCSKNIFSFNLICKICKFKTIQNINKLSGNFNVIETPKYIKNFKISKKFEISILKNLILFLR